MSNSDRFARTIDRLTMYNVQSHAQQIRGAINHSTAD